MEPTFYLRRSRVQRHEKVRGRSVTYPARGRAALPRRVRRPKSMRASAPARAVCIFPQAVYLCRQALKRIRALATERSACPLNRGINQLVRPRIPAVPPNKSTAALAPGRVRDFDQLFGALGSMMEIARNLRTRTLEPFVGSF